MNKYLIGKGSSLKNKLYVLSYFYGNDNEYQYHTNSHTTIHLSLFYKKVVYDPLQSMIIYYLKHHKKVTNNNNNRGNGKGVSPLASLLKRLCLY